MKALTDVTVPLSYFDLLIKGTNLNERQRRAVYGLIAKAAGYGGAAAIARHMGAASVTVKRGLEEFELLLNHGAIGDPGDPENQRIRRPGGGRKALTDTNPGITLAIKDLMEGHEYGDAMPLISWTTLSLRKLQSHLATRGFECSHAAIGTMLAELGYCVRGNQKSLGTHHPIKDKDGQFAFINSLASQFILEGNPVIAVDCAPKEFQEDFAKIIREGSRADNSDGDEQTLAEKLFNSVANDVVVANEQDAFLHLESTYQTGESVGNIVGRWLHSIGLPTYRGMQTLYVVCCGIGATRLEQTEWQDALASIASAFRIEIYVSHLPPGTFKWAGLSHRLISYTPIWTDQQELVSGPMVGLVAPAGETINRMPKVRIQNTSHYPKRRAADYIAIDIGKPKVAEGWNYRIGKS